MLRVGDAAPIATAFALGEPRALTGPVARGEEGRVWRTDTTTGTWAAAERDRQVPRIVEFVTFAVTRYTIRGILAAIT